jgi:acyl CoA:acetate/3-ketoacid CoA transferase alpha subunit
LSKPKETAYFNGKKYIREETLFADFSVIKAKRADTKGNLQFEMSERNFNQDMAKAAHCVIV